MRTLLLISLYRNYIDSKERGTKQKLLFSESTIKSSTNASNSILSSNITSNKVTRHCRRRHLHRLSKKVKSDNLTNHQNELVKSDHSNINYNSDDSDIPCALESSVDEDKSITEASCLNFNIFSSPHSEYWSEQTKGSLDAIDEGQFVVKSKNKLDSHPNYNNYQSSEEESLNVFKTSNPNTDQRKRESSLNRATFEPLLCLAHHEIEANNRQSETRWQKYRATFDTSISKRSRHGVCRHESACKPQLSSSFRCLERSVSTKGDYISYVCCHKQSKSKSLNSEICNESFHDSDKTKTVTMKTLRDIAKLSVPSLSTTQYLPSDCKSHCDTKLTVKKASKNRKRYTSDSTCNELKWKNRNICNSLKISNFAPNTTSHQTDTSTHTTPCYFEHNSQLASRDEDKHSDSAMHSKQLASLASHDANPEECVTDEQSFACNDNFSTPSKVYNLSVEDERLVDGNQDAENSGNKRVDKEENSTELSTTHDKTEDQGFKNICSTKILEEVPNIIVDYEEESDVLESVSSVNLDDYLFSTPNVCKSIKEKGHKKRSKSSNNQSHSDTDFDSTSISEKKQSFLSRSFQLIKYPKLPCKKKRKRNKIRSADTYQTSSESNDIDAKSKFSNTSSKYISSSESVYSDSSLQAPKQLVIKASNIPPIIYSRIELGSSEHHQEPHFDNCSLLEASLDNLSSISEPDELLHSKFDIETLVELKEADGHLRLSSNKRESRGRTFIESKTPRSRSPYLLSSPIPFSSPPNQGTHIEDGLSICSSHLFEKHIDNIREMQSDLQKHIFKSWFNHFCPNMIADDLVEDLKDGVKLIGILGLLYQDEKLKKRYKQLMRKTSCPTSRLQNLNNVSFAINYMKNELSMKLINLNLMDIIDGKSNIILGLCWNLILHYLMDRYKSVASLSDQAMLADSIIRSSLKNEWKYQHDSLIDIDGRLNKIADESMEARVQLINQINERFDLNASPSLSSLLDSNIHLVILKKLLPDESVMNDEWDQLDDFAKLDYCFDIAEKHLGIPKLLKLDEIKESCQKDRECRPMIVYISMLLNATPKQYSDERGILSADHDLSKVAHDLLQMRDRYEPENLGSTLTTIDQISNLLSSGSFSEHESINLSDDCYKLIDEANIIRKVSNWLDEAELLLEQTHRNPDEINQAIQKYSSFIVEPDAIKCHCPVDLMPIRRKCLKKCQAAKEQLVCLHKLLSDWECYEEAKTRLKLWLVTAESKLSAAMNIKDVCRCDIVSSKRKEFVLNDLNNFFEVPDSGNGDLSLSVSTDSAMRTGSQLSINSIDSRYLDSLNIPSASRLGILLEDFESKSCILYKNLESDQQEVLLSNLKDIKKRLYYITSECVPNVIYELRMDINHDKKSFYKSKVNRIVGKCETDNASTQVITKDESSNTKEDKKTINETACGADAEKSWFLSRFSRIVYDKLRRFPRTNLAWNALLLVALIGIFALPLIQKDACCQLGSAQDFPSISDNSFQKPT